MKDQHREPSDDCSDAMSPIELPSWESAGQHFGWPRTFCTSTWCKLQGRLVAVNIPGKSRELQSGCDSAPIWSSPAQVPLAILLSRWAYPAWFRNNNWKRALLSLSPALPADPKTNLSPRTNLPWQQWASIMNASKGPRLKPGRCNSKQRAQHQQIREK